jgi:hypothetical protein
LGREGETAEERCWRHNEALLRNRESSCLMFQTVQYKVLTAILTCIITLHLGKHIISVVISLLNAQIISIFVS